MNSKPKILVSPLNWGLGHATRCVRIIELLDKLYCNLIIAGNGSSFEYLNSRFPHIKCYNIPGLKVTYGKPKAFSNYFLLKIPAYLYSIWREKEAIKKIHKKEKLDIIISDNRPGINLNSVYSIYITHQFNLQLPSSLEVFQSLFSKIHMKFIKKFNECWVPDIIQSPGLSGRLSEINSNRINISRIGVLSRFDNSAKKINQQFDYDFLFILSGPEPQRQIFENLIIRKFKSTKYKIAIIRGTKPEDLINNYYSNIEMFNSPSDKIFTDLIKGSSTLVCRGGYSTIMDLAVLKRKAILVPTPGQSEQEYLALHLKENFGFISYSQKDFETLNPVEILNYQEWRVDFNKEKLIEVVKKIIVD